jgi:glyoxylase-like metal-dependent hydrolase (beta-lactamase superfamily II)
MALLYNEKFLFTGDHLWWDPETRTLDSPQRLVWRGRVLLASIEKLLHHRFEWILAGHGDRIKLSSAEMAEQLRALIERRQLQPAHR